jgi:hypothetical protein
MSSLWKVRYRNKSSTKERSWWMAGVTWLPCHSPEPAGRCISMRVWYFHGILACMIHIHSLQRFIASKRFIFLPLHRFWCPALLMVTISDIWHQRNSGRLPAWNSLKKSGQLEQNSLNSTAGTKQPEEDSRNKIEEIRIVFHRYRILHCSMLL